VQVGNAWLPRNRSSPAGDDDGVHLESPHILQGSLNALENVMNCVDKGWMAILSGPAASGKTSLVRLLANLTGNRLREFSMNSSIDTTELLGGFEQIDLQRHKRGILANVTPRPPTFHTHATCDSHFFHFKVSSLLNKVSEMLLLEGSGFTSGSLGVLRDIHSTWSLLRTRTRFVHDSAAQPAQQTGSSAAEAHHAFDEEQYSLMHQLLEKVHSVGHERGWNWTGMGAGVLSPFQISTAIQRLQPLPPPLFPLVVSR
jgi:energy-coupling factor transporter ATP-binding protein EcfA2